MDSSEPISNLLLRTMTGADRELLLPDLEDVQLQLRQQLEFIHQPVEHAYFMQSGLASMVAGIGGKEAEIGLVGRDGLTGVAVLLGDALSPFDVYMQMQGRGLRIPVAALKHACDRSASLKALLLRFARCLWIQASFTALATGQSSVEGRLARWLLMVHDRVDGDMLELTHEFLAVMIGVRRPGVTVALHELEGKGLVRSLRGSVIIRDRQGLVELADGVYTLPERQYERLIGTRLMRTH